MFLQQAKALYLLVSFRTHLFKYVQITSMFGMRAFI